MLLTYSAANAVIVKNLDHAHRDGADLLSSQCSNCKEFRPRPP